MFATRAQTKQRHKRKNGKVRLTSNMEEQEKVYRTYAR